METATERHIKESYKIALNEIKEYCKSINQDYQESIAIMNRLVLNELETKGKLTSIYIPLDRMKVFCSIWDSIKTEI